MNVIEPLVITDAILTDSNVGEDEYAPWDIATSYILGDRVAVIATHSVYEAVAASTGDYPPDSLFDEATNPSGAWLRVGATNRWRAFDGVVSDVVSLADLITYDLAIPKLTDSIAFLEIGGVTIRVIVKDTLGATVFDETKDIVDTSSIVDWFTYFTWESEYETEALVLGLPAYAGYTMRIEIGAPGATATVGQIVLGRNRNLGETLDGTEIGIVDYSRKERDDFGNAILIVRGFRRTASFNFAMPIKDERRVQRIISGLRATPAVYYSSEDTIDRGTLVYGFFPDFTIPLSSAGVSFATLEVESLS